MSVLLRLSGGDDSVPPSAVIDFNASDNLVGKVAVTWTNGEGVPEPTYDLYEDGAKVATGITSGYERTVSAGTRTYFVKAVNSAGETDSNSNTGASLSVPSAISNFNASDNLIGKVSVTFSDASGYPAPTYNLYENGGLVASGISSGHQRVVGAGVRSYYVKAVNSAGSTNSNSNNGTSKASSGSQTFTSGGTFNPPAGYTQVTICMIGAGASGACDDNNSTIGGGYAGAIKSQTVAVAYGTPVSVGIGVGGALVHTGNNGIAGGQSSFGAVVALGGVGGRLTDGYAGTGAIKSANCHGTYYDGAKDINDGNTAFGGQGGFGNGGYGAIFTGQKGQGYGSGGGAGYGSDGSIVSGAGANGYCRVTWS